MKKKKCVYVYDGKGAEKYSKAHLLQAFKDTLSTTYSISFISPEQIKEGLWQRNAAAIAFGGGFDLGFIEDLGPIGIQNIKGYVAQGGKYLGVCAGAYFGCSQIEFDKGGPLEVCGKRDLSFFPGLCEGPVYQGFEYGSFKGSRAVPVNLYSTKKAKLNVFYDGGGCFIQKQNLIDSDSLKPRVKRLCSRKSKETNSTSPIVFPKDTFAPRFDRDEYNSYVEILGTYSELEGEPPAVVKCYFGKGMAILSGVHVEYYSSLLDEKDSNLQNVIRTLDLCQKERLGYFRSLMKQLLLKVKGTEDQK